MNTEVQENATNREIITEDKRVKMRMSGVIASMEGRVLNGVEYNYYLLNAYYAKDKPFYNMPILVPAEATVPIFNIKEAVAEKRDTHDISQSDLKIGDCVYVEGTLLQTTIPTVSGLTKREYYLKANIFKIRYVEYTADTKINYMEGLVELNKVTKSKAMTTAKGSAKYSNVIQAVIPTSEGEIPIIVRCKTEDQLNTKMLNSDKAVKLCGYFSVLEKSLKIRGEQDTRQTFTLTTYSITKSDDIKNCEVVEADL